jgi:hypothetical protein
VQVLETYPHDRPPSKDLKDGEDRADRDYRSWNGGHVDVQITRSDWEATPRREMLAIWLWCNDVPLERGPMRVLLGSHLPLADHWEAKIKDPAKRAQLPRVHGLSPSAAHRESPEGAGGTYSGIPELMDVPFVETKPTKIVAKRGQALVSPPPRPPAKSSASACPSSWPSPRHLRRQEESTSSKSRSYNPSINPPI